MKRCKNYMIDYDNEECIEYMLLSRHAKDLDEFKYYLDKVIKTRKVYKYRRNKNDDSCRILDGTED